MLNYIKYDIFKKPLCLAKTYDHSATKTPKLTIIFLHGIASDSRIYHNTIKFLAGTSSLKCARFIAFDLLGHGKSYSSHKLNYSYNEQLTALSTAIKKANIKTPIIIVGHSLGTLIATKYAELHKKSVAKLILLSPPAFTRADIKALSTGPNLFLQKMPAKTQAMPAFKKSLTNIALNITNYKTFENLTTNTAIIYDSCDLFISGKNLQILAKTNPKYLELIETSGKHHIDRSKYVKILAVLEKYIHETI